MGALVPTTPARAGIVTAGAAVTAAADFIGADVLGSRGAILEIINGNAASDTVTIDDFGTTPSGSPLPSNNFTKAVANGTSQVFLILPTQGDPNSVPPGNVKVQHSVAPTVTYKLYPRG